MTKIGKMEYRKCVGIMLLNRDKSVFVAKRIDHPDWWQMPQGGIDEAEEVRSAVLRELKEEVGITNVAILYESKEWLRYDFPDYIMESNEFYKNRYIGQQQKWFLLEFLGDDSEININASEHPEFSSWCWLSINQLSENVVPFKKEVYEKIVEEFEPIINSYCKVII